MTIYPNPSTGTFSIEWERKGNGLLEIYNELGEKVFRCEAKNRTQEIDLSKEPGGIYFLTLQSEQGIVRRKVMINK